MMNISLTRDFGRSHWLGYTKDKEKLDVKDHRDESQPASNHLKSSARQLRIKEPQPDNN
jgi:hypothetical protein